MLHGYHVWLFLLLVQIKCLLFCCIGFSCFCQAGFGKRLLFLISLLCLPSNISSLQIIPQNSRISLIYLFTLKTLNHITFFCKIQIHHSDFIFFLHICNRGQKWISCKILSCYQKQELQISTSNERMTSSHSKFDTSPNHGINLWGRLGRDSRIN